MKEEVNDIKKANLGKTIVFTNGCFDILHPGHVAYLNEAKALGDTLVIGLNSDSSVKRLKGADRPVNQEQDRKFMLLNLKAVDHVVIFEEDTPYDLIKLLAPDTLVKGGDWKPNQIVGSDIVLAAGGQVLSLKFIDGHSTSTLISKVQGRS
tara:strand:+ start:15399 stop:15851 length:453 start_codon:yes stop_codon:yes gene_type:complete